jgi:hypothetical protein
MRFLREKGSSKGVALPKQLVLVAATAMLFASGCAGTSTFTAYPKKINPMIADLQLRKPIDFSQCLLSECKSNDLILYRMERGRMAQIIGATEVSMSDFSGSMESIKEKELKATVSVSDIGAQAAAVALNDNAIPYKGEGYEKVMLHHFQAMNYLAKSDLEGAGVEIRRANAEQEEALKRHEAELDKAQKEAEEKQVQSYDENSPIASHYAQLDEVAGKVKNSFQNAYTFYLSGFVYELAKQENDAYIDYKKALEIFPENATLQKDVQRLARKLDMKQDLEEFQSRFGAKEQPAQAQTQDAGELLVLFEDGFAPQKQEVKIPLPIPRVGIVAIAFPVYKAQWSPAKPLVVKQGEAQVGCTESICDIRALAVKSLKERIPALAVRQTLRAIAKGTSAKLAKDKLGLIGSIGADLWNLASENADLRSWLTLPETAQIMRVSLPAGKHSLTLNYDDQPNISSKVDVEIKNGGKTVLRVVRAGGEMYSSAMAF